MKKKETTCLHCLPPIDEEQRAPRREDQSVEYKWTAKKVGD